MFKETLPHLVAEKRNEPSDGQSIAELAITLPVLLLLLLGMLDLGRVFFAYMTTVNAAREGARYGAQYPPQNPGNLSDPKVTAVVNRAKNEAQGSIVNPSQLSVTVRCQEGGPNCIAGNPIQVDVTTTFQLVTAYVLGGGPIPLAARAEMVVFGDP